MQSTNSLRGTKVYIADKKGRLHRHGKIRQTVFHAKAPVVVGFIVRRPDFLLMFKRKERFLAVDCIGAGERGVEVTGEQAWDAAACKRIGIDLDSCVIWDGQDCRTLNGTQLGTVSNVFFDDVDGRIDHVDIAAGATERLLIGSSNIPGSKLLGYKDGAIIVDDDILEVEAAGGVAAKAGTAWAKTTHTASNVAEKAGDALNKGAYKTGEAIGAAKKKADVESTKDAAQKLGNRTTGMFKSFKEEFDKASKGDE